VRVVLTTIGSFGDLNPYIGLGLALKRRGHRPVLAVAHAYRPYVEDAGLECRPVGPHGDPWDRGLVDRIMHPLRGAEFLVRDLLMPTLREAYDDLFAATSDADAIVSHPLTFTAPLVAEKRGLPWAASVLFPMSFFSLDDPPQVVANPLIAAIHRQWPRVMRWGIPLGKVVTRSWGDPVQAMRRSLGLPRGGHPLYEGQFSPHLNLALFSRVLAEPQPDWPASTVVTGAVAYDAVHGALPDALAAFLDNGPPPVVFTLGSAAVSHRRAPKFYEVSAAAATALGLRAVLLVGKRLPDRSGEVRSADNRPATPSRDVFVAEWAPHSELFPRAAAIVHQGGAGTLHSALVSGRPMIVVPFAHDQPDNAARLERLGVARTIYPQQYKSRRVRAVLQSLLGDEDAKAAAAAIGEKVRAERGGDNAVDALETISLVVHAAGSSRQR
jgi:UDP:flavonoid glycosyltransferase YjiC (YdhE family)